MDIIKVKITSSLHYILQWRRKYCFHYFILKPSYIISNQYRTSVIEENKYI